MNKIVGILLPYLIIIFISIMQFVTIPQKLDIKMNYREIDWRESDQKVFIADIKKAVDIIDWTPEVSKEVGLDRMLNWLQK